MDGQCPHCGKETGMLRNHIRLSSGKGHGPPGQYPSEDDSRPNEGHDTSSNSEEEAINREPSGHDSGTTGATKAQSSNSREDNTQIASSVVDRRRSGNEFIVYGGVLMLFGLVGIYIGRWFAPDQLT